MKLIKKICLFFILIVFITVAISTILILMSFLLPDLRITSNIFEKLIVIFYRPRFIFFISLIYIIFILYKQPKLILSSAFLKREENEWYLIASLILGFYLWKKLILSVGPFSLVFLILISYVYLIYSIELLSLAIIMVLKIFKK